MTGELDGHGEILGLEDRESGLIGRAGFRERFVGVRDGAELDDRGPGPIAGFDADHLRIALVRDDDGPGIQRVDESGRGARGPFGLGLLVQRFDAPHRKGPARLEAEIVDEGDES